MLCGNQHDGTDSECECSDVTLSGSRSPICPGEIGLLACTTFNGNRLEWVFGDDQVCFDSRDDVCDEDRTGQYHDFSTYLLKRRVISGSDTTGNRTSILTFVPDPSMKGLTVSVKCRESTACACFRRITVIGDDAIQPPSNLNFSSGILRWEQPAAETVAGYIVTIDGENTLMPNQEFIVCEPELRVSEGLNGTVNIRAVSLCGNRSAWVKFDIIYAEASSSAPGPATDVSVLMLATLSMLLHWNF